MECDPQPFAHRTWWRRVTLAVVLGLLFVPVVFDTDDFPLSTYPMYSRTRSQEVTFVTAQGLGPDGQIVDLGLNAIGASDDPLVVAGELRAAIRTGRTDQQCREIVGRLGDAARTSILSVRIVSETHDVVDHAADRDSLLDRTTHAECSAEGDST